MIEVADSWVTTVFRRPVEQVGTKSGPSRDQVVILRNCLSEKTISDIMQASGRSNRTKFRNQVLKPLLEAVWLEMTIPDKPTSSKQKYRLTARGRNLLAQLEEGERRRLAELGGSEPQLQPIPRRRLT